MNLRSNEPFWLLKNGLLNSYPSINEDIQTEILIVGGGITGSLIAYQCMKDGYDTLLIDKREIANGSTSATTSMLQYEIDVPLFKLINQIGEKGAVASYRACLSAIDKLGEVNFECGLNCGFKKKESLYFAANQKDVLNLQKEFQYRKKFGFPVEWWSSTDIERVYQLKNTFGGILSKKGASMDAFKFTHDLLAHLVKYGLQIFDKTDIQEIKHASNRAIVTTKDGPMITSKKIIYCNGFESVKMIPEKFVKLLSTYAIVGEQSRVELTHLRETLFWNTANPYIYLRTTDDNRLLIGGFDEPYSNLKHQHKFINKKSILLSNEVEYLLPTIDFKIDFGWSGTFGETKDGLPYIGKHPSFPQSYFVLGFGGNGITFSAIGMEMVSDYLKGISNPLTPYFAFGR